jgi:hypothetical protein
MKTVELFVGFMEQVGDDPTMGPSHIGLYLAIVLAYERQEFHNPVSVRSGGLKRLAKISAPGTYHKCMRDLQAAGYIRYIPSYNPLQDSLVYLIDTKNEGNEKGRAGFSPGKYHR